jgi:hypothetical protein
MRRPRVEILYFEGCPNHEPARVLVQRLARQLRIEPEIRLVEVSDPDAAVALRFSRLPDRAGRRRGRRAWRGSAARLRALLSHLPQRGRRRRAAGRELGPLGPGGGREVRLRAKDADPGQLAPAAAVALAAAEIPPSKLGPARHARLTEPQRELYFWILRRFATDGRPSSREVRAAAEQLGLDGEDALETLSREDLVHRGTNDAIAVAYPFSGRPTAHRVRFPSGHEVDAMCAIDALGIAPMFGEQIEVHSRDPVSGEEIRAWVAPDGAAEWRPESAVVVAGAVRRHADACCGCCPVLNFFASAANAERWLAQHSEVRGRVISLGDAAAAGRAVFGDVLTRT